MQRGCILLLLLVILTVWVYPAQAELSKEDRYVAAQNELVRYFNGENSKSLEALSADFEALGLYQKSMSYLSYTSLLRDLEVEQFNQISLHITLLRMDADFCAMLSASALPTVNEIEAYARGRRAEAAHDNVNAIAYYQQCNAILDSMLRVRVLLMNTSSPESIPTADDYKITAFDNGTCMISGYTGNATTIEIPEFLDDCRVISISDYAFSDCDFLTHVAIPDSVTSIGDGAFYHCSSLTNVAIASSVTSIGNEAFAYCDALTSITLPNGIKVIGNEAFACCNSLTSIYLPNSIATLGANPFRYCAKLTEIRIAPDHPTLTTIDGVLYYRGETKALICYPCAFTAEQFVIPQDTLTVGAYAFSGCNSLVSIDLSTSVTVIGYDAFHWCSNLTDITIPASVTEIGDRAFANCPILNLHVPTNSYAQQYAQQNNTAYTTY